MYAGSLREKRVLPSQDRPGDNMEEGDAPKAVTPPKGTKNKMNEDSLLPSDDDDDDADLLPSSDDDADGNDADLHDEDDDDADLLPSDDNAGIQEGHADGDDDSSQFSEDGDEWIFPPRQRPQRRVVVNKKVKKEKAKTLVTTYKVPPEERDEPEFYYFAYLWGRQSRQMRKVSLPLKKGPPPPVLLKGSIKFL